MSTCDKCKGDGLIGVGENPHLKAGPVSTCDVCSGTGKIDGAEVVPDAPAPEEPKKNEDSSEGSSTDSQPASDSV